MNWKSLLTLLLLFLLLSHPAQAAANVVENQAKIDFPNTLTFKLKLEHTTSITWLALEYGDIQQTCGEVVARAFPEFTPGKSLSVSWSWDMRQSGSIPPGAQIWWQWRYKDAQGNEFTTERQTVTWLDSTHPWQTLKQGLLTIHWYRGDENFARQLLAAGQEGLQRLEKAGLKADSPIDIYVYGSYDDLRDAVLYEPSWTGGQAFPEYSIVIIGIPPSNLDWGRAATVHELTHVVAGHFTFSCLSDLPTWLVEGLAMYSEGELDAASQRQLDKAIQANTLLTLRSLSSAFSEEADRASLSYSQSYSVVKFLIDTYGQEKMKALLIALREGQAIDDALTQVYGFNVDGLEDAWRKAVGAPPPPIEAAPTSQPTPTIVPTIRPISGAPVVVDTPTPIPTFIFVEPSVPEEPTSDSFALVTVILILSCCVLIFAVGVLVLLFVLSRRSKGG
ncbi:MAG: peptidase MA family metallohydrolase [Anaerolineales bacterium]